MHAGFLGFLFRKGAVEALLEPGDRMMWTFSWITI